MANVILPVPGIDSLVAPMLSMRTGRASKSLLCQSITGIRMWKHCDLPVLFFAQVNSKHISKKMWL